MTFDPTKYDLNFSNAYTIANISFFSGSVVDLCIIQHFTGIVNGMENFAFPLT